ncbi:hypothetical protein PY093_08550 [Cytobacillus sp. S13-E01]|uniref:hypothetical protein n=1 Tax=Cytobacillus sp. S13-E01 TaxID=3031326 RepID=UPI0023D884FE|nr:hypothetical protein [Cytobacillus sp. S13-E01]MDF0726765.1 hypothetical protein [Cytobacillus sp. S13-E01]
MDKPKQGISIKINGKERKFKENKSEQINQEERNIADTELEAYGNHEIAAAQEAKEDDFSWVLPSDVGKDEHKLPVVPIEDLRKYNSKGTSKKGFRPKSITKRTSFSSRPFFLSIIMAVGIGTIFGIIILNLLTEVDPEEPVTATPQEQNQQSQPNENTDLPVTPDGKETVSLELAPLNTFVIQAGVYSNASAGQVIVDQIKSSGFSAAMLVKDGSYIVLAGIGSIQEKVKAMSLLYQENNQETFVKAYTIEGGTFKNVAQADSNFIGKAALLYGKLATLSVNAISGDGITDEGWKEASDILTSLRTEEIKGLTEPLQSLSQNITTAYDSLETYKNNGDKLSLWKSQQALLDGFTSYHKWVFGIS